MTEEAVSVSASEGPWDESVRQLRALRLSAGNPSYELIAQRISARREAAGMSPHAARVARTTVYDSLRLGRARLNVEFLYEIAEALGGCHEQVDEWIRVGHAPAQTPVDPDEPPDREVAALRPRRVVGLMVACIMVNLLGREVVDFLHLPIYLDMVGTAIAAIGLGPWRGAAVGGLTNLLGAIGSGWVSIPFAIVNIAGALVWGYGVRRHRMMATLPRFFALNLVVAVICSLLAVPILVVLFGGSVGQGQDFITATFLDLGNGLLTAVGFSNMLTSAGDKMISGFVALVVLSSLPAAYRRGVEWVRIP